MKNYFWLVILLLTEVLSENVTKSDENLSKLILVPGNFTENKNSLNKSEEIKSRTLRDDPRSTQLEQHQNYYQSRLNPSLPTSLGYNEANQYLRSHPPYDGQQINQFSRYQPNYDLNRYPEYQIYPNNPRYPNDPRYQSDPRYHNDPRYRYGYPPENYHPHDYHSTNNYRPTEYSRPNNYHPPEPTKNQQTSQVQQVQVQNINQNHYINQSPQYAPPYPHYGYRFGLPLPVIPLSLHAHFGGGGYGYGGYGGGAFAPSVNNVNNINNVQQIHEHICEHCHETNTYNEGDHYGSDRPRYHPHKFSDSDRDIDQTEFVGGKTSNDDSISYNRGNEDSVNYNQDQYESSSNYDQGTSSNIQPETSNYEAEALNVEGGGESSGGESYGGGDYGGGSDYGGSSDY